MNQFTLSLLKLYRYCISPLLPRACRFEPSCSLYAMGCFKKFSFFKALSLTLKRIARCHPFCDGGYDPVPEETPAAPS
ncbi:MAG: membrane protein insertion efficiency factor YidD [Deltaproteobacteria bacterium]|nr:membrane protein insertion efficiency factor YidD [Deltaproteobacteria bacterium]